ncbi:MAG: YjbQ family protein [Gaiellaceae bacterium]
MTSVEIPYSIACALPSLTVLDITNDVSHELARAGHSDGIAYVSPSEEHYLVRVSERETGLFEDLEELLTRIVPLETPDRERLLAAVLGPRTEQIPFSDGKLCLGRWQRVLLYGLNGARSSGWNLTIIG